MKKLLLFLTVIAVIGCQESPKNNAPKEKPADIFPVTSFIKEQLHMVDSFQLPTVKYTTVNNKTDTLLVSIEEFKQLAQEFFHPDINDPELRSDYKETSFADQSIKSITFNYTTENKDLEIKRLDVIVSANPVLNDKVRSIYMEKQAGSGDTIVYKKMYWRADKNFQVITTKQAGEQPPFVSVIKVEWDKE